MFDINEKNILKNAINKVKNMGSRELTSKESMEMMKNFLKTESKPIQKYLKPGALVTFVYNAKDKSEVYDRTPFVMVLSTTSKYMLGLNFHWMPISKRKILVQYILDTNRKQIRNKNPLKMSYRKLKKSAKLIGAGPVIRLYIRGRISAKGVKIPDDMLMQAVNMKTETFTKGKVNSTTLWSRAKQKAQTAKRKLFK